MKQKLWTRAAICGFILMMGMMSRAEGAPRRAAQAQPPEVRIPVTAASIDVNGSMDEPEWSRAARVVLKDNQTGGRVRHWTAVKVFRSSDFLFIGFQCSDDSIYATLSARDEPLWKEEVVEVFLDPTGEGREYLEIEVNPIGTLFDAWVKFGPDIDFDKARSFNLRQIRVATKINRRKTNPRATRGWTCEIAIPLSELPVRCSSDFRINFTRIDLVEGKHAYQAWSPTYRWFHVPEKFGRAKFR